MPLKLSFKPVILKRCSGGGGPDTSPSKGLTGPRRFVPVRIAPIGVQMKRSLNEVYVDILLLSRILTCAFIKFSIHMKLKFNIIS